ncbi:unnamed protein product [marine sediment metagenome]|uniref:Uncharacterized protein n=1 Tax=marine sediment metagenome TaxID=412755 RepID=X1TT64_9ZZZZ
MGYRTPPGVDERIVKDVQEDVADRLDQIGAHYINWNKFKVLEGGNAGQFSAFFLDQVQEKRTHEESLILIATAMPGKGKSYFCIRFAEILDPKFNPDLQIVFRREDFLFLVKLLFFPSATRSICMIVYLFICVILSSLI